MLKVALTGGIATGKSYVLAQLRARGVPSLDADELVRGITTAGTEATAAIAARFGADILAPDGSVNRAKLGPIVFADSAAACSCPPPGGCSGNRTASEPVADASTTPGLSATGLARTNLPANSACESASGPRIC